MTEHLQVDSIATDAGDARPALALSADENADLCAGCTKCCSYITVEIDKPRTPREYDQWLWAIMHRNVSLFVERPERWFVCFEAPCENLNDAGRCGIYGRHPVLCREYDPRECERRLPLADIRAWFRDAPAFEAWIQRERPRHWEALVAFRNHEPAAPPVADAHADRRDARSTGLLSIEEPTAAER
ncbi:MAG: hypothetical protein HOP12_08010 [Candidatus Eisenbacteria bacterium]|uniref:YkgJ family cysteine cluster protein n=1 Tax=Eiseniibacteriota bacterium TaxID=2212470 RepID=A0A849SYB7_UNCEI|nr:hypothetical protein [Candidatus Eisenbacteria bacterium]